MLVFSNKSSGCLGKVLGSRVKTPTQQTKDLKICAKIFSTKSGITETRSESISQKSSGNV